MSKAAPGFVLRASRPTPSRSALRASSAWLMPLRSRQCLRPGRGSPPPGSRESPAARRASSPIGRQVSHPPASPSTGRRCGPPVRAPEAATGVPDKGYRGPRQGLPPPVRPYASPTRINKPKTRPFLPPSVTLSTYRGARQILPGSPTSPTGVPSKNYRGARQMLPGSPAKTTGAPDKYYRGPRQAVSTKGAAKRGILRRVSGVLCFCLPCSVMLFNNNYREKMGRSTFGDR